MDFGGREEKGGQKGGWGEYGDGTARRREASDYSPLICYALW